jgi:hypothetical protein
MSIDGIRNSWMCKKFTPDFSTNTIHWPPSQNACICRLTTQSSDCCRLLRWKRALSLPSFGFSQHSRPFCSDSQPTFAHTLARTPRSLATFYFYLR